MCVRGLREVFVRISCLVGVIIVELLEIKVIKGINSFRYLYRKEGN